MLSTVLIYKALIALGVFAVSLVIAMYSTYGERKIAAFIQDRVGPDRAGPWGILQPLADGGKMFLKEELIPGIANKWLFILGPSISMFVANISSVVIPWARPMVMEDGSTFHFQVSDINIGVLYVFGVVSIGVYGIMIGGWASNNKYSLLGTLRASSQMISYELAMGLSLVALIMTTGSLSLNDIVEKQDADFCNFVYQPLGFLIFIICAFAECNRAPFDLPESESELVGGYHTEFTSMKLGFYLFAEYINMFASSALMATLYFGGYHFPFENELIPSLGENGVRILGFVLLMGKIIFFIFLFMWVRWTIPRFRYDQLMNLGWKSLLPLSILNLVLTGIIMAFTEGWLKF
ncbi:MAG: NADH-quinone oxidoreductase subunit NuoH [Saprospiraceae bacterium]|nr:NADH-quinone oxidoreductase subunit NuoH [Saprospiraceae bacterium]